MLDWWDSSQRFERYINFSEIFTYLSPPVTLKMRPRSLKSNQALKLVLVVYLCKFGENPSIGSRDILHTRL